MHLSLGRTSESAHRLPPKWITCRGGIARRTCEARSPRRNCAGSARAPFHWYENSWRRSLQSFRVSAVGFNALYVPPLNLKPLRDIQGTSFGDERSSRTVIFTRTRASCNRIHIAINTSVIVRSIIWSGDINTRYSTEKYIAFATAPRIWNIISLYTRTWLFII